MANGYPINGDKTHLFFNYFQFNNVYISILYSTYMKSYNIYFTENQRGGSSLNCEHREPSPSASERRSPAPRLENRQLQRSIILCFSGI